MSAIERAWGIVKTAVARNPKYNLKDAVRDLEHEFKTRLPVKVCKALCDKVSRTARQYYLHDLKQYGPDGYNPDRVCSSVVCKWTELQHEARGAGAVARAKELRQCKGCGWAYHQECLLDGLEDGAGATMWPDGRPWCLCGCESAEGGSSDGTSSDPDSDGEGVDDPIVVSHGHTTSEQIKSLIETYKRTHEISRAKKGPGDMNMCG